MREDQHDDNVDTPRARRNQWSLIWGRSTRRRTEFCA